MPVLLGLDPRISWFGDPRVEPEDDSRDTYISSSLTASASIVTPTITSRTCHALGLAKSGASSRAP